MLQALKGRAGPPGANGATGASRLQGKEGPQGREGPAGKDGAPGSAVAYAHVRAFTEASAMLDVANWKNVSAVSQTEPGSAVYWVSTTLPVTNVSGVVDAENESKTPRWCSATSA